MPSLSQEGNKVKVVNGGTRYYHIDDVSYAHNGITLSVTVNGMIKETIKYDDISAPSSTDIDDLVRQLNDYKISVSTTVDTTGLATEGKQDDIITELQNIDSNLGAETSLLTSTDLNTRLTQKKLDSLIELQIETNRLLKLILS